MSSTNNDIGKAFKEAFDGFEMEPAADLWASINERNVEAGNVNRFSVLTKIAASVAIIAIISAVAFFAIDKNDKQENPPIVETEIKTIQKEQASIVQIEEVNNIDSIINEEQIIKEDKAIIVKPTNTQAKKISNKKEKGNIAVKKPIKKEIIAEPVNAPIIDEVVATEIQEVNEVAIAETYSEKVNDVIDNNNEIVVVEPDTFYVSFGDDKVVCFGEDAILEVEDGYFYRWNTGDIMNKVKVSPTENSEYTVTVSDSKGNSVIHVYNVIIDRSCSALFIPSAFTPNADGQNDVFKAEGNGILKMRMFVFDRNGNKVFETTNIDDSWDGTYKGRLLDGGMFFYQAEYSDAMGNQHVKKGQVTLIK